jgi:hypothetical protein
MTRTSRATRTVFATVFVAGLLATACTGSSKPAKSSGSHNASTPNTAPATHGATKTKSKPAPKPNPNAIDPLTGLKDHPSLPTVSVKIDDTAPGRPQVGIDQANIVYIEEVEGGLTRLAAIFGSQHPSRVGYVRSTRPSDPDLLLQYGKITAAYSGGAHDSLPRMKRSGITSWSNDAGAGYYTRVSRAASSYINLVLNVKEVAEHTKTPLPKSIGLHWSTKLPVPGHPGKSVQTHVGGTLVDFRWDAQIKKYVRYIDGQAQHANDGKLIATPNVVVQKCRIVPHPQDTDVLGNPSMFTYTVGKGAVSVFRNGRRIDGTWSRTKVSAGTRLTINANHKTLALSPGGAWFVLAQKTSHITSH